MATTAARAQFSPDVVTPEICWPFPMPSADGRIPFRGRNDRDDADEPFGELLGHEAQAARSCDRDRLQLPAGSAVLHSHSPSPRRVKVTGNLRSPSGGLEIRLPQVSEEIGSDNSADIMVEDFFPDPMLLNLIHQALVNNQD